MIPSRSVVLVELIAVVTDSATAILLLLLMLLCLSIHLVLLSFTRRGQTLLAAGWLTFRSKKCRVKVKMGED